MNNYDWRVLKSAIKEQRAIRCLFKIKYRLQLVPSIFYLAVLFYFIINISWLGGGFILFSFTLIWVEIDDFDNNKSVSQDLNISVFILFAEMLYRLSVICYFILNFRWYGLVYIIAAIEFINIDLRQIVVHYKV